MMLGGDDAFWKMHGLLFEHHADWVKNTALFVEYARRIGLDADAFVAAMNGDEVLARIKRDAEEGANLGRDQVDEKELEYVKVNSTPSLFIDGKRIPNPGYVNTWKSILRMSPPRPTPPAQRSATKPVDKAEDDHSDSETAAP